MTFHDRSVSEKQTLTSLTHWKHNCLQAFPRFNLSHFTTQLIFLHRIYSSAMWQIRR